jgi:basic membrane protein A
MLLKKLSALALAGVVAFGVIGCGQTETGTEANEYKITLILDEGGVNDGSFNESAWRGALQAQDEIEGVKVNYIESQQVSDYTSNVETAVEDDADLIIGIGYKLGDTMLEASINYPDKKFAIIDSTYDEIPSNLLPITFNEAEAGYSVGLIAGSMSESGVVGFIGGMDIPSCSNFFVGYEKGVLTANPNATVLSQYANSFTDASKGRAIAQQMATSGADILFTAGGGVNNGVYEVCKEIGAKAIGVDSPCHSIDPEVIITSALKNIDNSIYKAIADLVNGEFIGGAEVKMDKTNGGVGYEQTYHLSTELIEYVDKLSK